MARDNEGEVRDGVRDGDLSGRSRPSGESSEGARPHFSVNSKR